MCVCVRVFVCVCAAPPHPRNTAKVCYVTSLCRTHTHSHTHAHVRAWVTEGNQIGISAHGMMFVEPNPTREQRAQVRVHSHNRAHAHACTHTHTITHTHTHTRTHTHTHTYTHTPTHTHTRTQIDAIYGAINWELFGPASDEPGRKQFLEAHEIALCDDAKQVNLGQLPTQKPNQILLICTLIC